MSNQKQAATGPVLNKNYQPLKKNPSSKQEKE
jgi:hypothetical protein